MKKWHKDPEGSLKGEGAIYIVKMCKDLRDFLNQLDDQALSVLIIKNGESIYSSKEGGMTPLLEAIDRLGLQTLADSTVVDKIVGKAAALLVSYFKAKDVYTRLLSRKAIEVLKKHGVRYCSERVVDAIRNKDDTDICPFEKMVLGIEDPREGYEKLRRGLRPG